MKTVHLVPEPGYPIYCGAQIPLFSMPSDEEGWCCVDAMGSYGTTMSGWTFIERHEWDWCEECYTHPDFVLMLLGEL